MEKRTVRTYLLLTICSQLGMSFIAATYVIFLVAKGLDLFSVNLVNFVFFATMILAEIPTGAIADMFGRKKSFITSCLLFSLSMFVYGKSNTIVVFMVAEGIGALARSFCNGAFKAWLNENLTACDCQNKFQGIMVKEKLWTGIAVIAGSLAGPILAKQNLAYPWFAGSITFIITAIIAVIIMKEGNITRQNLDFSGHFKAFKSRALKGVRYARTNRTIRFIIVVSALQIFAMQATNMQWAPLFLEKTGSMISLGAIKVGINLFIGLGACLTGIILSLSKSDKKALIVSQLLIGVFVLLTTFFSPIVPALIYFMMHEVFRGSCYPLKERYLQDSISSDEIRATVGSVDSMASNIAAALGLLLFGFVANSGSIHLSWILSGIFLIIGTLWVSRMNLNE